ncbi:nuclear transport factor 2 family protein [Flavobacteriaceae bacterium GSB9]|nr:nuclear transport factor 2 family protein [Flavobacteriaceae bacterium GSB9]
MKKFFLLGLAITIFIACQNKPQRYFESSPEIDILKAGIKAYEAQDWNSWKSNFVDTAKIHHNSIKPISPEENLVNLQNMNSNFSSYGFQDKGAFSEMVIDKDGETWVNYWGIWNGTLKENSEKIAIPVHLTAQFINSKIVEEYVYYDTAPITKALKAIEISKMEAEESTSEE